jgi:hypothetical protein
MHVATTGVLVMHNEKFKVVVVYERQSEIMY